MIFDWEEDKEKSNIKNHGIDFKEASQVFFDENVFEEFDKQHSTANENRFICVGDSGKRLLRVSYTIRFDKNNNEVIRIISARTVKKTEENLYYEQK